LILTFLKIKNKFF